MSKLLSFCTSQNPKYKYNILFLLVPMFPHFTSWIKPVQLKFLCWLVSRESRVHYSIYLRVVACGISYPLILCKKQRVYFWCVLWESSLLPSHWDYLNLDSTYWLCIFSYKVSWSFSLSWVSPNLFYYSD